MICHRIAVCIFILAGFIGSTNCVAQDQTSGGESSSNQPAVARFGSLYRTSDSKSTYWKASSPAKRQEVELLDNTQEDEDEVVDNGLDLNSDIDDLSEEKDRGDIQDERADTLSDWPRNSIRDINIDPRHSLDKTPQDRSFVLLERYARDWRTFETIQKDFCWIAPNIRYQPLYFEDVALERYGQSRNDYLRTAVSAAHFFSSAFLLPLHMRQDPIYSCDYPLGYCRPGNCTQRYFQKSFWGR